MYGCCSQHSDCLDDRGDGVQVPVGSRIFTCPYHPDRPPLWSSGQSTWLQIQRSGFYSRRNQISWKYWVWNGIHSAPWVKLRSYLENREYGRRDKSRWTPWHPFSAKRWHYLRWQAAVAQSVSSLADSGHGVFFSFYIIQPLVQWIPGTLSEGSKRQKREAGHWPLTSAAVKKNVDLHINGGN
jgi:hypothetical protein